MSSTQFIDRSRVADEFVAPAAAFANRCLAARGLGHLPPCHVSYFVQELGRRGAAIGLHERGSADIRLNLAYLADLATRSDDPEREIAFTILHEYAHFVVELLEAREAAPGTLRQRVEHMHAEFLRGVSGLWWAGEPVLRGLLSDHNAVPEEWFCDAFAHWAAGTLPPPYAAWFDDLLSSVRVPYPP